MSTYGIDNFPNKADRILKVYDFTDASQLSADHWAWGGTNPIPPTVVNDAHGGGVTLTCDSADDDSLEMVSLAEIVRLNRLGKTYKFLFEDVTLGDDDQIDVLLGIGKRPASAALTLLSDAVFMRKVDGETTWRTGHAYNAASTGDYSEISGGTVDTTKFTLGIKIETDPTTLGVASLTFYKDGATLNQNGAQVTTLPHDEELCIIAAVQNGEASAKTLTIGKIKIDIPATA